MCENATTEPVTLYKRSEEFPCLHSVLDFCYLFTGAYRLPVQDVEQKQQILCYQLQSAQTTPTMETSEG